MMSFWFLAKQSTQSLHFPNSFISLPVLSNIRSVVMEGSLATLLQRSCHLGIVCSFRCVCVFSCKFCFKECNRGLLRYSSTDAGLSSWLLLMLHNSCTTSSHGLKASEMVLCCEASVNYPDLRKD